MSRTDHNAVTRFDLRMVTEGIVGARVRRISSEAHLHAAWTLCLMRRGQLDFVTNERPHVVRADDAFVIRPFALHWGKAQGGPIEYDVFYVSRERARDWADAGRRGSGKPAAPGRRNTSVLGCRAPIDAMRRVLEQPADSSDALESDEVTAALCTVFRSAGLPDEKAHGTGAGAALAEAAARRLHDDEPSVDLRRIADELNVSQPHLCRVFRAHLNTTPSTYRQQIRVARVAARLAGGMGLSETAQSVGFADQAHMNRIFKKTYGFTPGQFTQQYRQLALAHRA